MVFFSGNFASVFFGMLSFRTPCSNLAFTSSHPRLPTNSVPLSDASQGHRHRNMRILPLCYEKSAFSLSERTIVFPMCHFAIFRWKQPCIGFEICRKSSGIGIPDSRSNLLDCKVCRDQKHFRVTHASLLDVFGNRTVIGLLKKGLQFCGAHTGDSCKHFQRELRVEMITDV